MTNVRNASTDGHDFRTHTWQSGFVQVPNTMALDVRVSGDAIRLFCRLAYHIWQGNSPTIEEMAAEMGLSERSAYRRLGELRRAGYVEVRSPIGYGRPNRYRLNPDAAPDAAPQDCQTERVRLPNRDARAPVVAALGADGDLARAPVVADGRPPLVAEHCLSKDREEDIEEQEQGQERLVQGQKRGDVERVCSALVEHVAVVAGRRPKVTEEWRGTVRLLLDRDERSEAEVLDVIRWLSSSEEQALFWAANVLSARTLRRQFDRLAANRLRDRRAAESGRGVLGDAFIEAQRAKAARYRAEDAAAAAAAANGKEGER